MSTYLRTTAALLTALALSAAPAAAQRRHEGGGRPSSNDGGNRSEARRAGAPRADAAEQRQAQPRREPRVDERRAAGDNAATGVNRNLRSDGPRTNLSGGSGDGRQAIPRYDVRQNDQRDIRRGVPYREARPRVVAPPHIVTAPRVVVPQYRYRPYAYSYPYRSYVVPYGYRPYGYRPGWSLNLYFGRPYVGGYYTDPSYGYYSLAPGITYGSVRIVDAPRDARVFVDGYYAGVVDEYDGVFQHLNLEPGAHHIEIEVTPEVHPIAFDVQIQPGQTVTIHAGDYYQRAPEGPPPY